MGHGTTANQSGIYGTLGTPAAGNYPGGRLGAASWTDSGGNLWLFGGNGLDSNGTVGLLNDLWEFTTSSNQWTWMGGSSTIANSCFQYDIGKNVCATPGVYGTLGAPAAGNAPGSRAGATTWTDSNGHLWLFGGWGLDVSHQDQYYYNELWEFDPSTKEWTWMGGSSTGTGSSCFLWPNMWFPYCGEQGAYGTLGAPSGGSSPGGRNGATGWIDNHGGLWLFGGQGFDANGQFSDLNDVWQFTPSTNQWAWMGGPNTVYPELASGSQLGVYGTLGIPDAGNIPPTRYDAASWKDTTGNLWLFGGERTGWWGSDYFAMLDDLWEFTPSTNKWTWMGGDSTNYHRGVYGTLGTPTPGNDPGERTAMSSWTDSKGNLWLFGGQFFGQYTAGDTVYANDVWEYQPAQGPLPTTATPTFSVPGGTYVGTQTVSISDSTNGTTIYYTIDGSTPTTKSAVYYGPISVPYSITFKAFAVAIGCFDSSVVSASYTLSNQAATPTFSPPAGAYLTPQTVTLSDSTPGATIYYNRGGSSLSTSSSVYTGPITLSYTGAIYAMAVASGYSNSTEVYATYTIGLPQAATPIFSVAGGTYNTPQTVSISSATPGSTIYYAINSTPTTASSVYTSPITVSSTETLEAIAVAPSYANSSLRAATYTITPLPDFSLAASPASMSLAAGQSGKAAISVTPLNGFNSAVSFTCSGLPLGASCSFSPSTLTLSGTAASTTLTVTASPATAAIRRHSNTLFPGAVFVVALCSFSLKKRRPWKSLFVLASTAAVLSMLNACGGQPSPQLVTSTVTISARGGSLQHTTTLSLTVN
jgi:N-acetylneuraminic acid mutarotase